MFLLFHCCHCSMNLTVLQNVLNYYKTHASHPEKRWLVWFTSESTLLFSYGCAHKCVRAHTHTHSISLSHMHTLTQSGCQADWPWQLVVCCWFTCQQNACGFCLNFGLFQGTKMASCVVFKVSPLLKKKSYIISVNVCECVDFYCQRCDMVWLCVCC